MSQLLVDPVGCVILSSCSLSACNGLPVMAAINVAEGRDLKADKEQLLSDHTAHTAAHAAFVHLLELLPDELGFSHVGVWVLA